MASNVLDKKKNRRNDAEAKNSMPPALPESDTRSLTNLFRPINRCQIEICRKCRKHASCFQKPIAGSCLAFDEGPAWDHVCEEFKGY